MRGAATMVLLAAGLVLLIQVSGAPECTKDQHQCVRNSECCGGCCNEGKCVPHADGCAVGQNPCSVHQCDPGEECYLHQVQCVAAPCEPVPACRSPDYADYEESR